MVTFQEVNLSHHNTIWHCIVNTRGDQLMDTNLIGI